MHLRRLGARPATLSLAVLIGLLGACGGSNSNVDAGPSVSKVDPSSPKGTVWGSVVDAADQSPLAGATVTLSIGAGAATAQTDAEGDFVFTDVPAGGQAAVTLTKDGYTRATVPFAIPGETGNFPAEGIGAYVGPIGLFATTGALTVQVVGRDGVLVQNAQGQATVAASFVDFGTGTSPAGLSTATGTSTDGMMQLSGLPSLSALATYGEDLRVMVAPIDVNADGIPDYVGQTQARSAEWLLLHGGRFTITLEPAGENTSLSPIASNVGSIFNGGVPKPGTSVVSVGEPVRVVFNQPVDPASVVAVLYGEDGKEVVPSTATVQSGNVVLVSAASPLEAGRKYYVLVDALAQGTDNPSRSIRLAGAFFTPAAAGAELKIDGYQMIDENVNGLLDAGDEVLLTLNQAIGLGDGRAGAQLWFPGYLNVDLNGSGPNTGDAYGEWNSDDPFPVTADEIVPPAPFLRTGFTRYYRFTMPYVPSATPYEYAPQTRIPYILHLEGHEPGYQQVLSPSGAPFPRIEGSFVVSLTTP